MAFASHFGITAWCVCCVHNMEKLVQSGVLRGWLGSGSSAARGDRNTVQGWLPSIMVRLFPVPNRPERCWKHLLIRALVLAFSVLTGFNIGAFTNPGAFSIENFTQLFDILAVRYSSQILEAFAVSKLWSRTNLHLITRRLIAVPVLANKLKESGGCTMTGIRLAWTELFVPWRSIQVRYCVR